MINKNNVFFHIDADSFFASVEISYRPELRDKDIAICGNKGNSVVSALSYSAKLKNAKVPMKLYEVKHFCPDIINIKPNYYLYEKVSKRIYNIIKNYAKVVEVGSIDEWYFCASNLKKKYSNPLSLAKIIQKDIYKQTSITVSIGISYNKFLAKMATDLDKPNGITIIKKNDVKTKIWPLSIDKYVGIGKSISSKLKEMGILTIGDLANIDKDNKNKLRLLLKNKLNKYLDNAHGINDEENTTIEDFTYSTNSSVGIQYTFEKINHERELSDIYLILKNISKRVANILKRRNLNAKGVSITIKYLNKTKFSISKITKQTFNNSEELFNEAKIAFDKLWNEDNILMIGISVFNLQSNYLNQKNISLFNKNIQEHKNQKIINIINETNLKMKKDVLKLAINQNDYGKNE